MKNNMYVEKLHLYHDIKDSARYYIETPHYKPIEEI